MGGTTMRPHHLHSVATTTVRSLIMSSGFIFLINSTPGKSIRGAPALD